jgi:hypothetical protein
MKKLKEVIAVSFAFLIATNSYGQIEVSKNHYEHSGGFGDPFELFYSFGVAEDTTLADTIAIGNNSVDLIKKDSSFNCYGKKILNYEGGVVFPGYGSYSVGFVDSSSIRNGTNIIDSALFGNTMSIFWSDFTDNLKSIRYNSKSYHLASVDDSLKISPSFENHEGDSLRFKLLPIGDSSDYWLPDSLRFNPTTGEIIWENPDSVGTFEFKMESEEYGLGGVYKGSVQNDFIVKVVDSNITNATFTEVSGFYRNANGFIERRITPGQSVDFVLSFEDDIADSVNIKAIGEPFSENPSPFFFTSYADSTTMNASFSWTPDSSQIRPYPYTLTFIGKSYPSCTFHYKTVMIYVHDPSTSLKERNREGQDRLHIYPNPVGDKLLISTSFELGKLSGYVLNAQGRIVKSVQLGKGKKSVDVQSLDKGVYFLIIEGDEKKWQERFVKN